MQAGGVCWGRCTRWEARANHHPNRDHQKPGFLQLGLSACIVGPFLGFLMMPAVQSMRLKGMRNLRKNTDLIEGLVFKLGGVWQSKFLG